MFRIVALLARTTAFWLEFCRKHSIPSNAVNTVDDLVAELPLTEHPTTGAYRQIPPPVRFARTPAGVRREAPLIGEHSVEMMRELGYDDTTISALVDRNIVRHP